MKEINYWLLARLPRWIVVLMYMILAPLAIVSLVIIVLTTYEIWIMLLILGILGFLILLFYIAIDESLPSRKKKKNDEDEIDLELAERLVNNFNRNLSTRKQHLEDGNYYYSQDIHIKDEIGINNHPALDKLEELAKKYNIDLEDEE